MSDREGVSRNPAAAGSPPRAEGEGRAEARAGGVAVRLSEAEIERMRLLVEGTARPLRSIAREMGVNISKVSRLTAARRWRRPAEAPRSGQPPGGVAGREAVLARAWRLAERYTAHLETQPADSGGALSALASLTRALTTLERTIAASAAAAPPRDEPDEPPARSLEELRTALAARLEQIVEDERAFLAARDPDDVERVFVWDLEARQRLLKELGWDERGDDPA